MVEGTGAPPAQQSVAQTGQTDQSTGSQNPPTLAPPTQQGEAQTGDEAEEIKDPAAFLRAHRELQARAKTQANRLAQLEAAHQKAEDAKLSETDRQAQLIADLQAKESTLQAQIRERTVRYEIAVASQKLGIVDPDAAYRLLDRDALEFDDAGEPTNTERVLTALLKARPFLQAAAGPPVVSGTTNSASRARGPEGARIYRASELSDPAFFRAHREDIGRAMNEGRVISDQ